MKETPLWGKKVNFKLIEMGMSKKELAQKVHVNYTQLCSVVSGTLINDNIKATVSAFLGIEI